MTSYVILHYVPESDVWEKFATANATSPNRALTAAKVSAGQYVAVPARSWKPLTVKTEQVTKVTIG